MSEDISQLAAELKETMVEIMKVFEKELTAKNQQLARAEQQLLAQQQLTIQANDRLRQLEKGCGYQVSKVKKSSKR
ncbi:hypothetical protein I6N95_04290 [Vagococcus sp. BWB3-3]|uniref:Uncharacterized protein n=1 Tax=Vagococcus allomyrinae TaxID=2794353 RepID=A0A940SQY6_9ENTE|nr:hypothetical protein [Vagococcus allomyrinae]MBP1040227.1 hypothetical protein [Vagococcus allomyrinae]